MRHKVIFLKSFITQNEILGFQKYIPEFVYGNFSLMLLEQRNTNYFRLKKYHTVVFRFINNFLSFLLINIVFLFLINFLLEWEEHIVFFLITSNTKNIFTYSLTFSLLISKVSFIYSGKVILVSHVSRWNSIKVLQKLYFLSIFYFLLKYFW